MTSQAQRFLSRRDTIRSLCYSALTLLPFAGGRADETEGRTPEWLNQISREAPGNHANFRPVSLEYTLDWNHRINAGRVGLSIGKASEKRNGQFVGDASGQSTGFARFLYPYDFKAQSIVNQKTLRPVSFQLVENECGDENRYDVQFEKQRQIYSATSISKGKTYHKSGNFDFDCGYDALSSACYLRGRPLNEGETISMIVTPFNRPYFTTFTVTGREKHKIKSSTYDAIKLDAKVSKLNADLSLTPYEKVKKTTLWFSDDEYRIPLEMQSQLAFGYVSARLDKLNWLE